MSGVIIVGSGQGALTLATSLRDEGFAQEIVMIGDEGLPYQRPPLSKGFLEGKISAEALLLRNAAALAAQEITLVQGKVTAIDRAAAALHLEDGSRRGFHQLVLATGARPRPLPGLLSGQGVHHLRGQSDAVALRAALEDARHVVVIGGGFIGLEFAAVARARGLVTSLLEAGPRLLGRAASPALSELVLAHHRAEGIDIRLETAVARILRDEAGRLRGVETATGAQIACDLVMVGIGALANDDLARAAGLACDNGILVDPCLGTEDPRIFALGDCAAMVLGDQSLPLRLESVQNAMDGARYLAKRITGTASGPYRALPWFWSDQGKLKLQMAGLASQADQHLLRDQGARQAIYLFAGPQLVAVETVNWPAAHLEGKRLLACDPRPSFADIAEPSFSAKAWLARSALAA